LRNESAGEVLIFLLLSLEPIVDLIPSYDPSITPELFIFDIKC